MVNVDPYARARRVRALFDPEVAEADPCPPDLADRTLTAIAEAILARRIEKGIVTFRDILACEVAEAFAEEDPARLRAELLQVAAVAVQWVEAIDARAVTRG